MEIYIEYVLIDNVIINYIIITLSLRMLKMNVNRGHKILGVTIGTIFAFIMPFIKLVGISLLLFKCLIGLLIVLSVLDKGNMKHLVRFYLCFLFMTFAIGGVCFGILYAFTGEIVGTNYTFDIPVGSILGVVCLWAIYIKKLISMIYKRQSSTQFLYDLDIVIRSKKVRLKAYLDSGNMLQDQISKKPIIVVYLNKIMQEFSNEELYAMLSGNEQDIQYLGHYMEYKAMSVTGKMFVLQPKMTYIVDIDKYLTVDTLLGISLKPLSKGKFDALLSPKVLSGGV